MYYFKLNANISYFFIYLIEGYMFTQFINI